MLLLTRRERTVTVLILAAAVVGAGGCGGGDGDGAAQLPVISGLGDSAPEAPITTTSTSPPQAPSTTPPVSPRPTAAEPAVGGDGPGTTLASSSPVPSLALDISPLPNPPTDAQRRDPAVVARQWAGLKVLTSGMADGPLWPYSVAANLAELSDPTGVYVPGGRLLLVVSDNLVVTGDRAHVNVRVDIAAPAPETTSHTWNIELAKADHSDFWLVADAQLLS